MKYATTQVASGTTIASPMLRRVLSCVRWIDVSDNISKLDSQNPRPCITKHIGKHDQEEHKNTSMWAIPVFLGSCRTMSGTCFIITEKATRATKSHCDDLE